MCPSTVCFSKAGCNCCNVGIKAFQNDRGTAGSDDVKVNPCSSSGPRQYMVLIEDIKDIGRTRARASEED